MANSELDRISSRLMSEFEMMDMSQRGGDVWTTTNFTLIATVPPRKRAPLTRRRDNWQRPKSPQYRQARQRRTHDDVWEVMT